jgi:hypothetical protein
MHRQQCPQARVVYDLLFLIKVPVLRQDDVAVKFLAALGALQIDFNGFAFFDFNALGFHVFLSAHLAGFGEDHRCFRTVGGSEVCCRLNAVFY